MRRPPSVHEFQPDHSTGSLIGRMAESLGPERYKRLLQIIVGGIVALFGAALAFRLPKKKLESDASVEETVKEIVRNPAIPRVQLEMDDFAPSSKP